MILFATSAGLSPNMTMRDPAAPVPCLTITSGIPSLQQDAMPQSMVLMPWSLGTAFWEAHSRNRSFSKTASARSENCRMAALRMTGLNFIVVRMTRTTGSSVPNAHGPAMDFPPRAGLYPAGHCRDPAGIPCAANGKPERNPFRWDEPPINRLFQPGCRSLKGGEGIVPFVCRVHRLSSTWCERS